MRGEQEEDVALVLLIPGKIISQSEAQHFETARRVVSSIINKISLHNPDVECMDIVIFPIQLTFAIIKSRNLCILYFFFVFKSCLKYID